MSKQEWKPGNMVYPLPAVMVSVSDKEGNDNIITVAWTGTICTNPPMVYISVRPERHSYNMLKETSEFVINLTTKDLVYATDYCGVKSGKMVDKFKEMQLTKIEGSHVSCPMIEQSPVNIECQVTEIKELGSHHMFIARVLAVHIEESYLNDRGKFELIKANPIVYSHGEYFSLDKQIGTFGYSVRKKNKSKKSRTKQKSQQIEKNHHKKTTRSNEKTDRGKTTTLKAGSGRK